MVDRKGQDFAERWQEIHYFLLGMDPNRTDALHTRAMEDGLGLAEADRLASVVPELSLPVRSHPIGVYPPWTYVFTAPLGAPASLPAAKALFAGLNSALYIGVMLWCFAVARTVAAWPLALLVSAACLSFAAFRVNAMVGNHALLVLALLIVAYECLRRERAALAGLAFGLAMLKPTLSGPFVLVFLLRRRRWVGAAVATTTVLAGCAAFWLWTGDDPLRSFLHTQARLPSFDTVGVGVTQLVDAPSAGDSVRSQRVWTVGVLIVAALLLFVERDEPLLHQFAICAVAALVWTFHRRYDQTVLVFVALSWFANAQTLPEVGRRVWCAAALVVLWAMAFLPVALLRWFEYKWVIELSWCALLLSALRWRRPLRERASRS